MLYSCTHMATMGVKGLMLVVVVAIHIGRLCEVVCACCLVPEQPTNLQGEAISPTSIQLTWDEPRGRRDDETDMSVDSYELYYNDSHLRQNVRVTISPPVNSYRLDDLTPDTVYHIRVSARSAARGESASTPTIQVRTPDYGS